jgi:hypothetical protein
MHDITFALACKLCLAGIDSFIFIKKSIYASAACFVIADVPQISEG